MNEDNYTGVDDLYRLRKVEHRPLNEDGTRCFMLVCSVDLKGPIPSNTERTIGLVVEQDDKQDVLAVLQQLVAAI